MLGFFRRYQKPFFVVISVVVIVSFIFFGAFTALSSTSRQSNKKIERLVDGSYLKEKELYGMVHFLGQAIEEEGSRPNVLNGSFVRKEILLPGLGEEIARHFFSQMKTELAISWKRMKTYAPYCHPFHPSITASQVWAQFYPEMNELFAKLRSAPDEFSQEQISLLFAFYKAEAKFPPSLLAQMLYYQEQQVEEGRKDPFLASVMKGGERQLSLFGFQTIDDWFGPTFMQKVAGLIFQAAALAKKEGHKVERDAAKKELFSQAFQILSAYYSHATKSSLSLEQFSAYCQRTLGGLGITEKEAIFFWQQIALFRSLVSEIGEAVFVDRTFLDQFKAFAKPSYLVKSYTLPRELCFTTFEEMLLFQRYIEAACEGDLSALPTKLKSFEEIEKETPELVYKTFNVQMAQGSREEIAQAISLRQTWDWQAKEESKKILKEQFPQLFPGETSSTSGWIASLEKLKPAERWAVDRFSREQILKEEPGRIIEYLAKAPLEKKQMQVSFSDAEHPLDGRSFLTLLETRSKALDSYSPDGQIFYSFSTIEEVEGPKVFSFAQAKEKGILQRMLDKQLETASGSFGFKGPLVKVKEQVALKVYARLIKEIETKAKKKMSVQEITAHRFDHVLQEARKQEELFLQMKQSTLWPLYETEEERFTVQEGLQEGEFSSVEGLGFYQLLQSGRPLISSKEIERETERMKEAMQDEAKQALIRSILGMSWKGI